MKNYIEYFYRIQVDNIIYKENIYYINSNTNKYILEKVNPNKIDLNSIYETQRYRGFHKIIPNFLNEIISIIENESYILMFPKIKEERNILLNDIINISKIYRETALINKQELVDKWTKKIDMLERYIMDKDSKELSLREYYDYYIGLSENAIQYIKFMENNFITYGFTYKRIDKKWKLIDLYNPVNVTIDYISMGIGEYIKEFEENDYSLLLTNLNYNDLILLIGRILFPTYFYDKIKNNSLSLNDIIEFTKIENKLKILLNTLKKRHNMPQIKWITN